MHAWQFDRYGHYSDVLNWVERPTPQPGPNQALVRTVAMSLNFPDLLIIQGLYQHKAPLPAVPGVEGVGIVEAVGPGCRFEPGDRVVGFSHSGGTLADYFVVENHNAWSVPDHVGDTDAAALSVTYGTSYFALGHRAHLQPGETLLVLGGAGGVGTAAIQLGRAMGARVIGCASDATKLEICRKAGAQEVINYRTEDLVERVKELTGGRGADVVYDPVGGDAFDLVKRCTAWEGRIVIIGFASGRIPSIECNRLLLKNMAVMGLAWGQYVDRGSPLVGAAQEKLYGMLKDGQISPILYRTLAFADVKQGLAMLEGREVYGKIVVTR
jgi:NADPH2:quinone reductase